MFPKRLRAVRNEIEKTVIRGKNISGTYFYAKISENTLKKPGFAIIVSKKTEKTSVGRHLIKRKASAVLENIFSKEAHGFDKTFVLFAKKIEKGVSGDEIRRDIKDIAKRAGII